MLKEKFKSMCNTISFNFEGLVVYSFKASVILPPARVLIKRREKKKSIVKPSMVDGKWVLIKNENR